MTGALDGVDVLEVANYVTGPYAGMLLGDLGANVVKVERRPHGDPFRGWGSGEGYSSTFGSLNRNKKSIVLDLANPEGKAIFLQLTDKADVVIENFRPGVMQKLGVDYETVSQRNRRIIYCSISGFGQEGPYQEWPGYDTLGQGMGGLLSLLTDMKNPKPMGISLSDHLTGLFACYGILGALFGRTATGDGQKVETSLLQSTASFISENAARYFETGQVPSRESRAHLAQVYAFVAGDSRPFVIHLSSPPKFWEGLTRAVGKPELAEDPRFHDRNARAKNYDQLHALLSEIFVTAPREDWIARMRKEDVPCGPLNNAEEVFQDPQVKQLGMAIDLSRPEVGELHVSGNPIHYTGTPVTYTLSPPLLGEHTEEVLRNLGYDTVDLERLAQSGII